MHQLNLFQDQIPELPTFQHLAWYADKLGIQVEKNDRKDVKPLFLKCMQAIKPMMDYCDRMTMEHGLDEYISPDFFLFYVGNEKAAQTFAGSERLSKF